MNDMYVKNLRVRRGEIYWINPSPWKETGEHTIKKVRPGVIVSSDTINAENWSYEVVFLTTSPKRDDPTHCTIRSGGEVSTALCEQITTISNEQLGRYAGTCTDQEMATIENCILLSLGIEDIDHDIEDEEENETPEFDEELYEMYLKAKAEAEVLQRMYNELLEKTLGSAVFDKRD